MAITVVVAEGHPLVRTGLLAVLSTVPELRILGATENGTVALEMADRLRPDVLMAAIDLPEINGLEAARYLAVRGSPVRVLILTSELDNSDPAQQSGALGWLDTGESLGEIVRAVRAVASGRAFRGSRQAPQPLRLVDRDGTHIKDLMPMNRAWRNYSN